MRDNFAVFILTHGRAKRLSTLNVLRRGNYSGKWYLIVDDEDSDLPLYREKYGEEKVVVYSKQNIYDYTDTMDNFNILLSDVYARNVVWMIAKQMALKYFLMLDDDYSDINFKCEDGKFLRSKKIRDLDSLFEAMMKFLDTTKADAVSFAQGGDLLGGANGHTFKKRILRKSMNSYFCRTDCPIKFKGTMNADVNTYTLLSSQGHLFFTYTKISIDQRPTQSVKGGTTAIYKEYGTYVKSFYSVMAMPSAVKVAKLTTAASSRIHHRVQWDNCAPKIISEKWKKK